ncbi:MAG: hypothetical protein MZU95_04700 [Desulfomicrobium escambiense]|nr:hypothetical protein [Desulfomicrobium escambiense]
MGFLIAAAAVAAAVVLYAVSIYNKLVRLRNTVAVGLVRHRRAAQEALRPRRPTWWRPSRATPPTSRVSSRR